MPTPHLRELWDRFYKATKADPQKAAILTVLVAILVVLQVRMRMNRPDSLALAKAGFPSAGLTAAAIGVTGTVSGGRAQDPAAAIRQWMDAPPAPLGRNLFAVNLERFPQDSNRPNNIGGTTQGFWDDLAKSLGSRADVRKQRQILSENLQQQAAQLRLQSTMMGASPKAVIDGELVGEGSVVACGSGESRTEFRVLKIEPRRIIVEREGIKLEIQMK